MSVKMSALLYGLPSARLREIVIARRINERLESTSKKALVQDLANKLAKRNSIVDAYNRLTWFEQQILSFVIMHGGLVRRDLLVEELEGRLDTKHIDKALDALETSALVFGAGAGGDGQDLACAPAVVETVGLPSSMLYRLSYLANRLSSEELRVIAGCLGIHPVPSTKEGRSKEIQSVLTDPLKLSPIVQSLSGGQREILETILDGENEMTYAVLCSRLSLRYENYGGYLNVHPSGKSLHDIQTLFNLGLVFRGDQWGYNPELLVAREVREAMRGHLRIDWHTEGVELESTPVDGMRFDGSDTCAQDFAAFLSWVHTIRPAEIQKGGFSKTDLKRAGKWLNFQVDERYVLLLSILSERAGLVSSKPIPISSDDPYGRTRTPEYYVLTPDAHRLLAQRSSEFIADVVNAWLGLTDWSDFSEDPMPREPQWSHVYVPALRRLKICSLLLEVPPGRAVSARNLMHTAVFRWPTLFAPSGVGNIAREMTAGVERTLSVYLVRMGITETFTGSDGTIFARVRDDARELLMSAIQGEDFDGTVSERIQYDRQFVVQPNMEIIAGQHIHPTLLLTACRFAHIGTYQQAIILKISADSIRTALDQGMTGKEIISFMEKHSASGVPQNVRHTVDDIAAKHGLVRLGKCDAILVVRDEHLLEEIQANRKLAKYVDRMLTPQVAAVSGSQYDAFIKELRKAGYLPVDESDHHAAATSDAWLEVVDKAPSLSKRARRPALMDESYDVNKLRIDWDGLDREVEQPEEPTEVPALGVPSDAVSGRIRLSKLTRTAISTGRALQMRYLGQSGSITVREVEPHFVNAKHIGGFCRSERQPLLFLFDRIHWARLI